MKEVPVIEKKKDDSLPYAIFFESVGDLCEEYEGEVVVRALRTA